MSHPKINFDPLINALREISSWLDSNCSPLIISATLTAEEFREQRLPSHCKISKRSLQGTRVAIRGRRKANVPSVMVARWPKDGLLESEAAELMFVIGGTGDLRLSDYILHCRKGDIIYVPARLPKFDGQRPTYEIITPQAYCDILFIRSQPSHFGNVSVSISHSYGNQHNGGTDGEASWHKNRHIKQTFTLFGDLMQEGQNHKSTFYALCTLVALLREDIQKGNAFNSLIFPSDSANSFRQDSIKQALEYTQNHLNKPLTIDQVARWVGLSRTIFTTRFREKTGQSFKEYQTELRIEKAKVLLENTNLTIEQISEAIGITPGQFRQLFHQKHHCSPRKFRNSKKNVR